MITASEPLEFVPRGRKVIKIHPGPGDDEEELLSAAGLPVELVLLRQLENVKISLDEKRPAEYYRLREMPLPQAGGAEDHQSEPERWDANKELPPNKAGPSAGQRMPYHNQEEELYVCGKTAVWTLGIGGATGGGNRGYSQISYTCGTPIRFAFFCPSRFVRPNTARPEQVGRSAVAVIDSDTIYVFCADGETYKASLLCPIASVWMMPDGIMLQRCFDDHSHVPMFPGGPAWPRLFTLTFTLEEMKPMLLVMDMGVMVMTEPETRMVFSSDQTDLVLLYSETRGRHLICRLRHATHRELDRVQSTYVSVRDDYDESGDDQQQQQHGNASAASFAQHSNLKNMRTFEIGSASMTPSAMGGVVGGGGGSVHASGGSAPGSAAKVNREQLLKEALPDEEEDPVPVTELGDVDRLYDGPSYCLRHIWTENNVTIIGPNGQPVPLWSAATREMASTAFLHTDLVGNKYLCYLQARACRLTLVQYQEPELTVVGSRIVSARSAIGLDKLNMMVVLDMSGKLVLYSGPVPVGKLHVAGLRSTCNAAAPTVAAGTVHPKRSTLLPNVTPSEGKFEEQLHQLSPIRPSGVGVSGSTPTPSTSAADLSPIRALVDATGLRFTLVLGNGRLVRVTMAPVAQSRLVRRCLDALKTSLPNEVANEFIVRWYGTRNVPGSQTGFTAEREWRMFSELLFQVMGRPTPGGGGGGAGDGPGGEGPSGSHDGSDGSVEEPRKRRRAEEPTNSWNYLLQAPQARPEQGEPSSQAADAASRTMYQQREPFSLYPHIATIVETLHLLYEDLKMHVCHYKEWARLGDFLYRLSRDGDLRVYQAHYFLDQPQLIDRHVEREVYSIPTGLEELATGKPVNVQRYMLQLLEFARPSYQPLTYSAAINAGSCDVVAVLAYIYRVEEQAQWAQIRPGSVVPELEASNAPALRLSPEGMALPDAAAMCAAGETVLTFLADRGYTRNWIECLPLGPRFIILRFLEQYRPYLVHGQRAEFYELLARTELREHEHPTDPVPQKVIPVPEPSPDIKKKKPEVPQTVVEAAETWKTANIPRLEPVVGGHGVFDTWASSEMEISGASSGMTAHLGASVARPTGISPAVSGSNSGGTSGATGTKDEAARMALIDDADGMGGVDDEVLKILYPDDKRMKPVRRFLNSSQRAYVTLPKSLVLAEPQLQEELERRLYAISQRTMALPVGRGMYTLASWVPAETQIVPVPRLCLTGRSKTRFTIDIQQMEVPPNMTLWPLFHNGVAAGLRVCPGTQHITSAWITHNRPVAGGRPATATGPPPPPAPGTDSATEHAGFLLGLGLTGHLRALSNYSKYEYMVNLDETVRLGLLLGLAAAYRGTADTTITRLLAVHVEALLPPTAVELDVVQSIQVASVLGVGLLYQGTAKPHIAEVLLQEIGRPPGPEMENSLERESYALAAGLALGLVMLGRGNEMQDDLRIPEQLFHYMNGGYRRPMEGAQREKYRLPSFQIKEGPAVNVDVTSPGATLSLGLIYFGTGNETIANWLQPPASNYMLGFVRPDLQLLRTLAAHLVHWDRISPSLDWVRRTTPSELVRCVFSPVEPNEEDTSTCRAIGARPMSRRAERQLYCQSQFAIISGSLLAIGLRYAGTADKTAYDTITVYLNKFIALAKTIRMEPDPPPTSVARMLGFQAIENCILMALLALSLVMAGTGDLGVLRYVRKLRLRCYDQSVTYGSQMAVHMALGFLFLGGGRYTLSRSPAAIAALVCAIFPKFPMSSNDNRYHLQAFRHLYMFAVEPRILLPRDIDTGRLCMCSIRYGMRGEPNAVVEAMAPCLLPELDTLEWVELSDSSFWSFRFDRDRNWELFEKIMVHKGRLAVKQHMGSLSYHEDPSRLLAHEMDALRVNKHRQWHYNKKVLLKFKRQLNVLNMYMKLVMPMQDSSFMTPLDRHPVSEAERRLIVQRTRQLTDSVMQDRAHGLQFHIRMSKMLHDGLFSKDCTSSMDMCQMLILSLALTHAKHPFTMPNTRDLAYAELMKSQIVRVKMSADGMRHRYFKLVRQFLLGAFGDEPFDEQLLTMVLPKSDPGDQDAEKGRTHHLRMLTKLLVMYDVPYCPAALRLDDGAEMPVAMLLKLLETPQNTEHALFQILDLFGNKW